MKKTICFLIASAFFHSSYSQITKGNWLVGGNASFAKTDYATTVSGQYKRTDLTISPSLGYFVADKFGTGISASLEYGRANLSTNTLSATILKIGPFLRYYFLQTEHPFNLFAEGNYAFGTSFGNGQKQHAYSIEAGPVLYFNSSVGLEFTFGYTTTKVAGYSGRDNVFRFGIGFQIHLEK